LKGALNRVAILAPLRKLGQAGIHLTLRKFFHAVFILLILEARM
jgi:hypothetical protein